MNSSPRLLDKKYIFQKGFLIYFSLIWILVNGFISLDYEMTIFQKKKSRGSKETQYLTQYFSIFSFMG